MPRLFSDLLDGSGRRYFFGLSSAPGSTQPSAGALQVIGHAPSVFIQVQVFRTPAPALITLVDPGKRLLVPMQPAPAVITQGSPGPALVTQRLITPTVTADYTEPVSIAPTIVFVQTITPTPALITVQALAFALGQGGDIGFIQPLTGQVSLAPLNPTLIFFESAIGTILVQGLEPTLVTSITIEPLPGSIAVDGLLLEADLGFVWIDVPPPPPLTWTTTTGISS